MDYIVLVLVCVCYWLYAIGMYLPVGFYLLPLAANDLPRLRKTFDKGRGRRSELQKESGRGTTEFLRVTATDRGEGNTRQ